MEAGAMTSITSLTDKTAAAAERAIIEYASLRCRQQMAMAGKDKTAQAGIAFAQQLINEIRAGQHREGGR
jgi:hypothetical protein